MATEIRANHLRYAPWTLYTVIYNGHEIWRGLSVPDRHDIELAVASDMLRSVARKAPPKPPPASKPWVEDPETRAEFAAKAAAARWRRLPKDSPANPWGTHA